MTSGETRSRRGSLAWLLAFLLCCQFAAGGIQHPVRAALSALSGQPFLHALPSGPGLPLLSPAGSKHVQARPAGTKSPSWVRDGVIYEVFPRDFSQAGNLNGVTQQLDRLKDIGIPILWLMPIHPIGLKKRKGTYGSPYSIRDYYAIDPELGTKADLLRLVRAAHRRGMKVIMDLVAGHTAWDSVMMKWPVFYKHNSLGRIISPEPDWTDVAALDYSNPELRSYLLRVAEYWVRNFGIDGYRCDAADRVPLDFWQALRAALQDIKPEVFLLDEADRPDFLTAAFDADYSWPLFHSIEAAIAGQKPVSFIRDTWVNERASFPPEALHMRFIDDHDEKRAVSKFGPQADLAASALIFTIDGVPLVYNGMETGDRTESGAPSLFERLPISWKLSERNTKFSPAFRELIALRRDHPALRSFSLQWIENSDSSRVLT
ncbi:MAG: alpha-amylase family glycosyl hydrolase, partial [Blastocatellia bacterium]